MFLFWLLLSVVCRDRTLPGSIAFLHILWETWLLLVSLYLHKDMCTANNLKDQDTVLIWGMLIVQHNKGIVSLHSKWQEDFILYKRFGFLISRFLIYNPAQHIYRYQPGPILMTYGIWGIRRTLVNMLTLMVLAETWVIKCTFINFIDTVRA